MDNFVFYSPTEFVFGRGTQIRTGELTCKYGGRKVMIVSGGSHAEKSGLLSEVRESLTAAGIEFTELKGIAPNPMAEPVYTGIELARREKVDFMLAVGGGSVVDTAKAIALGVPYDGDFWDFYSNKAVPSTALPVGVVLTIPAAGSEGSGNSVITKIDELGRHKISVRYPMVLRPRFAVMNPELTLTLPWFQTACGIVDMLAHIFERYFSNTPDCAVTDSVAEGVMRAVIAEARTLTGNPDNYQARANVMWAGTLAHNGLCGCGKVEDWASHRLEHELSAFYDVAHGAGLAVMIPAWMSFVAEKNPGKVEQFATKVMGVDAADKTAAGVCKEGIARLLGFYKELGMVTSIRELIGREPDIAALTESLHGNIGDTLGAYVPLSMNDCAEIYRRAL